MLEPVETEATGLTIVVVAKPVVRLPVCVTVDLTMIRLVVVLVK